MSYSLVFNNFLNWIELNFYLSLFLFFIFIFLYSVFSLPGLVIFFVFAGYSYGFFLSYIICLISVTLGCFIFFIISKYFLSKFFEEKYKTFFNKIDKYIKSSSIEYLIILRLIPGPPLMFQNILLSLLDISPYKFIFSTLIGISPIMIFCVLIGNKLNDLVSLNNINSKDVFTWDLILILFTIIFIIIIRIKFKRQSNN